MALSLTFLSQPTSANHDGSIFKLHLESDPLTTSTAPIWFQPPTSLLWMVALSLLWAPLLASLLFSICTAPRGMHLKYKPDCDVLLLRALQWLLCSWKARVLVTSHSMHTSCLPDLLHSTTIIQHIRHLHSHFVSCLTPVLIVLY